MVLCRQKVGHLPDELAAWDDGREEDRMATYGDTRSSTRLPETSTGLLN